MSSLDFAARAARRLCLLCTKQVGVVETDDDFDPKSPNPGSSTSEQLSQAPAKTPDLISQEQSSFVLFHERVLDLPNIYTLIKSKCSSSSNTAPLQIQYCKSCLSQLTHIHDLLQQLAKIERELAEQRKEIVLKFSKVATPKTFTGGGGGLIRLGENERQEFVELRNAIGNGLELTEKPESTSILTTTADDGDENLRTKKKRKRKAVAVAATKTSSKCTKPSIPGMTYEDFAISSDPLAVDVDSRQNSASAEVEPSATETGTGTSFQILEENPNPYPILPEVFDICFKQEPEPEGVELKLKPELDDEHNTASAPICISSPAVRVPRNTNLSSAPAEIGPTAPRTLIAIVAPGEARNPGRPRLAPTTLGGGFPCPICQKPISTKRYLTRHMKLHSTAEKRHKCDLCSKRLSSNFSLVRHAKTFHAEESNPEDFHFRFRPSPDPDIGSQLCTRAKILGDPIKPSQIVYIKDNSDGRLDQKFDPEIEFSLQDQDQGQNQDMSTGSKVKVEEDSDSGYAVGRRFLCGLCGEIFLNYEDLKEHDQSHSHDSNSSSPPPLLPLGKTKGPALGVGPGPRGRGRAMATGTVGKKFKCPSCPSQFRHKRNLNRHLKTHDGLRPFKCSICPKDFAYKHHLRGHLNTHSKYLGPDLGLGPGPGSTFDL